MSRSGPLLPDKPPRRAAAKAAWVALTCTLTAACAISVPPSGGPEDKKPPAVVATVPARDSVAVSPEGRISITFSEDMTRTNLAKLVTFSPEIEIDGADWKGRTMILKPSRPLHPDTTYVVTIASGYADNHRVQNKSSFQFAFATSAAIDSGRISGRVYFRRKATAKGVVRCFVLPRDSSFSVEATRPDRSSKTDQEGKYEIGYLPTRGNKLLLWAFEDANGNGSFGRDSEVGWARTDTIMLTSGRPVLGGRDIYIVDPKEPAVVEGIIKNQTGVDTVTVSVALDAVKDTIPAAYLTRCDKSGAYKFGNVLTGVYVLRAFMDFFPDSLCGEYPCTHDSSLVCFEPCVWYPDTLRLEPGDELTLKPMILEPAAAGKEESGEN